MSNSLRIDDATMLSRPSNLVASDIDGEMVILNIDTGHFFQLNRVGSRIWETLDAPMTIADLCRAMEEKFDVDQETCSRDVTEFLGSLSEHGLVMAENDVG